MCPRNLPEFARHGNAVFGVVGPYGVVQALSGDMIFLEQTPNGTLKKRFKTLTEKDMCEDGMYFIKTRGNRSLSALASTKNVEIEVESNGAVFAMKVWDHE